jgi:pyridoxine 4-oxidase
MRVRHFDIIIVGGGSAGSVLAARLSENAERSVALLEAGFEPSDPDIAEPSMWPFIQGRDYDWAYETIPQAGTAGRVHPWPRGRLIGGSSCLHAMAHVRGHPDDFRPWAEITKSRQWSYEGLLPAFIRSESFSGGASAWHGTDGPMPVYLPGDEINPVVRAYIAAGQELGVPDLPDHNGPNLNGTSPNSLTIRDGKRVSAADAYLTAEVRARPNLAVLTGVLVHSLSFEGTRATGVEITRNAASERITADEIILSAGAVATPLLLMRSGVGAPDVLRRAGVDCKLALSGVGRNLHDHLLGAGNVYRSRQPIPPTKLQHSESLMYLNAGDITKAEGAPDIVLACVLGPSASESFEPIAPGFVYSFLFGVTHPTSRGSLAITGPDIADRPMIDPAYMSTEHDRLMFRKAFAAARHVGNATALDDWRQQEILPGADVETTAEIDDFIANAAITHHHPVGTCSTGTGDDAVVDPALRLMGLDNLHIVDASVIPTITSGPVHASILAIAETFAAHWR